MSNCPHGFAGGCMKCYEASGALKAIDSISFPPAPCRYCGSPDRAALALVDSMRAERDAATQAAETLRAQLAAVTASAAAMRSTIVVRQIDSGGWECMGCQRTAAYNDLEGLEHEEGCSCHSHAGSALLARVAKLEEVEKESRSCVLITEPYECAFHHMQGFRFDCPSCMAQNSNAPWFQLMCALAALSDARATRSEGAKVNDDRIVCTVDAPAKNDNRRYEHPAAVSEGSCSQDCCEYYKCPICGMSWKEESQHE